MFQNKPQILVIDDEVNLRRVLSAQLTREGYDVHTAEDGESGLAVLAEHHLDVVITDLRMPRLDGMAFLREALRRDASLPVIMLTAHGTVDTAVEALKSGAFDYITKPFDQAEVRSIVKKALESRRLAEGDPNPVGEIDDAPFLRVAREATAGRFHLVVEHAANQDVPLLIRGERGTGKELVAREIYRRSQRAARPFIKVRCAAIAASEAAAELFGVEAQAAAHSKPGRLELAAGGVLFLDDVYGLEKDVQLRLANALALGWFERVGGVRRIAVECRVLAATQLSPSDPAARAAFLPELAAVLEVSCLVLEPLRARSDELAQLAHSFVVKYNLQFGKRVEGLSEAAITSLVAHPWPGNLRELENVIERAVLVCDGTLVNTSDLPLEIAQPGLGAAGEQTLQGLKAKVRDATSRIERELIQRALTQSGGNVTHAARVLKISRKGLQLKMKELGLRERDERT